MRKILIFFILTISSCYRLPLQEEVLYRGRLENALVETFPKKIVVVIHPFENKTPADTNRAYLENAIPDNIEAMLETLRSSLGYIPFDGMPFYVSAELSNLFQSVDTSTNDIYEITTNDGVIFTNEIIFDEVVTNEYGVISTNNLSSETNSNTNSSYFSYLTNYLLVVPTQETQYNAITTTNTNYYEIETNVVYANAVPVTNIVSNRIFSTTTNGMETNFAVVNKNLLTPTNMLLLLYEEFPELTNYLSFLPIEIRRATENDTIQYQDYKTKLNNPKQWKEIRAKREIERAEKQMQEEEERARKQAEEKRLEEAKLAENSTNAPPPPMENSPPQDTSPAENSTPPQDAPERQRPQTPMEEIENSTYPRETFEYVYHIGGSYTSKQSGSQFGPAETSIKMEILPAYSSGNEWWEIKYDQTPPLLSEILEIEASLDPEDIESYKSLYLRTPVEKPPVSPRLKDEFETYSTNFRDTKPEAYKTSLPKREKPLNLVLNVNEQDIPKAMMDWLKYFHAIIINRPYTPLIVETDPDGTLIYLNGVYVGTTPLVYPTAPLGEQRITFLKDGYSREEVFTEILPNQTNSISYRLQALNNVGVVRVTSPMPDAEVYVNALFKGNTPVIISNLSLNERYRVEILNPNSDLSSNRNSVYRNITLTEDKPSVDIDARFKDFETAYRTPYQKGLLAATYVSWFTTLGLLGGSVYTQYRYNEARDLMLQTDTSTTEGQALYDRYYEDRYYYDIATQATLYSSIAMAMVSTGIMGWYLHSKGVYLGLDVDPEKNEWYAKFKLEF